jgi:hypothetical protein
MPLLGVTEKTDRAGAQALHRKSEIREGVVPRQRLANQAKRAHIERHNRIAIGCGVLEPALAPELMHQVAACAIEISLIGRKIRGAPGLYACSDRAMALVEEWPVKESLIRH